MLARLQLRAARGPPAITCSGAAARRRLRHARAAISASSAQPKCSGRADAHRRLRTSFRMPGAGTRRCQRGLKRRDSGCRASASPRPCAPAPASRSATAPRPSGPRCQDPARRCRRARECRPHRAHRRAASAPSPGCRAPPGLSGVDASERWRISFSARGSCDCDRPACSRAHSAVSDHRAARPAARSKRLHRFAHLAGALEHRGALVFQRRVSADSDSSAPPDSSASAAVGYRRDRASRCAFCTVSSKRSSGCVVRIVIEQRERLGALVGLQQQAGRGRVRA